MNIFITNDSKEAIYTQIVKQIKEKILTGHLNEGDLLPSMRQLAKDLHISLITTKRAYQELEKEGYIYSVVGKGSFVASQNTELIKEQKLMAIEEILSQAIVNSKKVGLSLQDLKQLLTTLYEDEY